MTRCSKLGGGLVTGVLKDLNPMWLKDGGDQVEAMTVKCSFKKIQLRITNAYGPQEYDDVNKKILFWQYLDKEILDCQSDGSSCIILMDANAWLGKKIIKKDPHTQNKNGLMFESFLLRNSHLQLVNAMDICEGLITRSRTVENRSEQSIIDFVIVCDKLLPFTKKLLIDEKRIFSLSNYGGNSKITHSDHNSLVLDLDLRIEKPKIQRKIVFNYKDEKSLLKFKKITSDSNDLSKCLSNDMPLPQQIRKWSKQLKKSIYSCFKKVRLRKSGPKKCLIFRRRKKAIIEKNKSDEELCNVQLSAQQAKMNYEKISNNISKLKSSKNSQQSIWELKKKFFPKIQEPKPTAKKTLLDR